jgi:hypothetical protein
MLIRVLYLLGKSKCMSKTGDCVVKHPNSHATGMAMVVSSQLLNLGISHLSRGLGVVDVWKDRTSD